MYGFFCCCDFDFTFCFLDLLHTPPPPPSLPPSPDEELLLKEYTHIGTVMDFHFKVVFTVSEEKVSYMYIYSLSYLLQLFTRQQQRTVL